VTLELWPPGPAHWLDSHHSFRACGAFLVALRAPPALSSCPLRQPLGHQCGPTSSTAAYPPCGGLLCSRCGASTLAWCPCLCVLFRSTRPLRSCKKRQYYRARSVGEAGGTRGSPTQGGLIRKTLASRLCSL